jgi:glutamine amidotransferase
MDNLKKYNLISIIEDYVKTGKPLLGICLGMQLLFEKSEEFGETKGLGLIEGDVLKIPIDNSQKIKLPHVSWNEIKPKNIDWENTILENIEVGENMYFVHTFFCEEK